MQRKSQSVRLVSDDGSVLTVDPDFDGAGEPVELDVASGDKRVRVTLDAATADALADAIDEARNRRRRQRGRSGEGEQMPVQVQQ